MLRVGDPWRSHWHCGRDVVGDLSSAVMYLHRWTGRGSGIPGEVTGTTVVTVFGISVRRQRILLDGGLLAVGLQLFRLRRNEQSAVQKGDPHLSYGSVVDDCPEEDLSCWSDRLVTTSAFLTQDVLYSEF